MGVIVVGCASMWICKCVYVCRHMVRHPPKLFDVHHVCAQCAPHIHSIRRSFRAAAPPQYSSKFSRGGSPLACGSQQPCNCPLRYSTHKGCLVLISIITPRLCVLVRCAALPCSCAAANSAGRQAAHRIRVCASRCNTTTEDERILIYPPKNGLIAL